MEQFFTSLSKRQTMLLLTSLAFGSAEAVEAYTHLPKEEEELLRHRAEALLQIPREKRIPLLVQEIKRLITWRRRHLATVDPKRLVQVLKSERPAMVEVVLSALPVEVADAARAELGNPRQLKLAREVKPEILSIIRWKLEDAMRQGAPQVGSFRFTDLPTLQQREIMAVADRMGARVLATALAGLTEADLQHFLSKLPPDQRALAVRAVEAGAARRLSEKDAKLVLEVHGAIEDPSLGMRSAGVQRIARACLAQSPEFAQRLAERFHPQSVLGKLMNRWLREERNRPVKGDGGRLDIVEQLERLAQKNIIDRPMRLPPPMFRPPVPSSPPGVPAASPAPRASSERHRAMSSQAPGPVPAARRPSVSVPVGQVGAAPGDERKPKAPVARASESQVRAQVLRDGKPLERRPEGAPAEPRPARPPAPPPLQAIPRRREQGAQRSPVVKGAPARGPKDGSR